MRRNTTKGRSRVDWERLRRNSIRNDIAETQVDGEGKLKPTRKPGTVVMVRPIFYHEALTYLRCILTRVCGPRATTSQNDNRLLSSDRTNRVQTGTRQVP